MFYIYNAIIAYLKIVIGIGIFSVCPVFQIFKKKVRKGLDYYSHKILKKQK